MRRRRAQLDDVLDGRGAPGDPLADLVAAAQAPARPAELRSLDAAMAVFSSAEGLGPVPEEKPPVLNSIAGRLLALKVLGVVAGTAAAGGVAYAAVNGNLDRAASPAVVAASDSSGAPGSSAAGSSVPGSDGSSMPGSGSESEPSSTGSSSGSSSSSESGSTSATPSLKGLCTAWLAHPQNDAKLAGNPAYRVLVSAAGDVDAVNTYCATVLSTERPQPSNHPTHPAHPTQAQNAKSNPASNSNRSHTKTHPSPANSNATHGKRKGNQ